MNEKELAKLFHKTYERLAPEFGYKTRPETQEFSESSSNGKLMIAVCKEILEKLQSVLADKENELEALDSKWRRFSDECDRLRRELAVMDSSGRARRPGGAELKEVK